MRYILPLLIAALASALPAQPATGATESGTVGATISVPVQIAAIEPLNFGFILPGTAAGRVDINPNNGARTTSGGVQGVGGPFRPAQFVGYGSPGDIVVTFPSNFPTLTRVGGTETMQVTRLTADSTWFAFFNSAVKFVPASGMVTLNVGGRLEVPANPVPGNYVGTYNVTMNYF
ncbi:MAG: DUF4402 domain-containing protein [Pacificimonas sp.]